MSLCEVFQLQTLPRLTYIWSCSPRSNGLAEDESIALGTPWTRSAGHPEWLPCTIWAISSGTERIRLTNPTNHCLPAGKIVLDDMSSYLCQDQQTSPWVVWTHYNKHFSIHQELLRMGKLLIELDNAGVEAWLDAVWGEQTLINRLVSLRQGNPSVGWQVVYARQRPTCHHPAQ